MKEQTITVTNLRAKTRQVVTQVQSRGQPVIVQSFGEPVAAIVGLNEYRELMELKRANAERKRRFQLIRQAARRNALTEAEALTLAQEARNATTD